MAHPLRRFTAVLQKGVRRMLARLDAWANALVTWRYNPLYHSGALVVLSFLILLVTGLYLLIFYRIGSPHASVERITGQTLTGLWIRTLHRYASALALVATAVHALRMFAQGRSWGPRALAWISGVVLLFVLFLCGWTGYVMVWDGQARLLAEAGARLLDSLPLFAQPVERAFSGEAPMPPAFFFLNLFAHIALPVGLALLVWVHVSRLARTYLLPPRPLLWTTVGLFTAAAMLWPVAMDAEANLLRLPGTIHLDLLYSFWVPASLGAPPLASWGLFLAAAALLLAIPALQKPPRAEAPPPSVVAERFCTGCEQCYHDCPYEAITMVRRSDGRDGYVARVDPAKCVSCGICAGSCAPMGVGPAGRTGRAQLDDVRAFIDRVKPGPKDVVLIACSRGPAAAPDFMGAPVFDVSCTGSLHTSVIEYLVRAGAGGVLVASCPPRDCWNREGVFWLEERVNHGREAELQPRVDRRRVRLTHAGEGEVLTLAAELAAFRSSLDEFEAAAAEAEIAIDTECEVPLVSVAEEDGS